MVWRQHIRRLWYGAITLFVIAAAAVAVAWGLAQSQTGRKALGAFVGRRASAASGLTIHVGRIVALSPSGVRVASITASDAAGECARVNDIVVSWSLVDLLRGQYHLYELRAGSARLERAPKRAAQEPGPPGQSSSALARLRIDDFGVGDLTLAAPLVASETRISVSGDLGRAESGDAIRTSLHVKPLSGIPMQGDAEIVYHPGNESLEVKGDYREPDGGLVSRTLRIHPRGTLAAHFEGQGKLTDWHGSVAVKADGVGDISVKVAAEKAASMRVTVKGGFHAAAEALPAALREVVGKGGDFAATVVSDWPKSVELKSSEVTVALGTARVSGSIDPGSSKMNLAFHLDGVRPQVLSALVHGTVRGPVRVAGTVRGALKRPGLTADVSGGGLAIHGVHATGLTAHVECQSLAGLAKRFPGLRIRAAGKASGLGLKQWAGFPVADAEWSLAAEAPELSKVHVIRLAVDRADVKATLSGSVNLSDLNGEVKVKVTAPRLERYLPESGARGAVALDAHLKGDVRTRSASGTITGVVSGIKGVAAPWRDLVGDGVKVSTRFDVADGKKLTLADTRVEAGKSRLKAGASVNLASKDVEVKWRGTVAASRALSQALKRAVTADVTLEGGVSGVWPALDVKATAKCPGLRVGEARWDRFEGRIEARRAPSAAEGRFHAAFTRGPDRATFDAAFSRKGPLVKVTTLRLAAPGCASSGSLAYDLDKRALKGSVTADLKDIGGLSRMLGQGAEGSGRIKAAFATAGRRQDLTLNLEGRGVRWATGALGHVEATASVKDLFKRAQGTVEVKVDGAETRGIRWSHAGLTCQGDVRKATFRADAAGVSQKPFSVKVSGQVSMAGRRGSCRIAKLTGKWGTVPIGLTGPAGLAWSAGQWSVAPCAVSVGKGSLHFQADLGPEAVLAKTTFEKLPIGDLAPTSALISFGAVSGQIEVHGRPASPAGEAEIHFRQVRATSTALHDAPPASLIVKAALADGTLHVNAADDGALLGRPVSADVALPVEVSLAPMKVAIPRDQRIEGHFTLNAKLDRLGQIVLSDNQRMTGTLAARIDLSGTMAEPVFSGRAEIENGSYDHFSEGTTLRKIHLLITGDGSRLQIKEASATDGGQGTITASGWLEPIPSKGFPLDVTVRAAKATLVRRDDLTAAVDGRLTLSGDAQDRKLGGTIALAPVEYHPLAHGYQPMSDIDVIRADQPPPPAPPPSGSHSTMGNLSLGIQVNIPGRLMVRDAGLESEWKGHIKITGKASKPSFQGAVKLVRGHADVLGKRFTLTKGVVTLTGGTDSSPQIDISAQTTAKDWTVYLNVSGTTDSPKITLNSNPPAPQNEILARVLFGQSLDRISPLQAVRLAQAAETFSGGGLGVFQMKDRLRKELGLDVLNVEQGSEKNKRATTVSAGKYLGNRIYVGVQQGPKSEGSEAHAEVQLTPDLSLEGKAGRNAKGGVGLKWKKDY